ncbi:MAG: nuclear transport factor 2 family protein [Ilumatobacteraceae bacterium]|nr:nuclear transport factor 2 family protein [Ilumatobacteraceae bacterium]
MNAEAVVSDFFAAVERIDIDAAVEHLADDISYENMPVQPVKGKEDVRNLMSGFLAASTEVEWRVLRQHQVGNVVFNERLDRFKMNGGWLELPVAGVFEVDHRGKITLWRDYFDMGTYMDQLTTLMQSQ